MDAAKNFAIAIVSGSHDASTTTLNLTAGEALKLSSFASSGSYNLVWWNFTDYPNPADDPNVEIVRVVGETSTSKTIVRGQEGTTSSVKNTADKVYKVMQSFTKKAYDDITSEAIALAIAL